MTDLPLFTYCKFIVNDKIPNKDGELFQLFTNILNFKISSIVPLIIEKDWPSQEDLTKLAEALNSLIPPYSKNCDIEERQRESFQPKVTTENVESRDSEQMLPNKQNGYEQHTKHTQTICDDARNTDVQALGTHDDKHGLVKVDQVLKVDNVSADQKSVSANKVFEENAMVSVHGRQKDVLQILKNTPDEEKETPASQGATAGPKGTEELVHNRSLAALLSFEGMYEKEKNPATRLLERDNHDIQRNNTLRMIENNETVYEKVKSQKLKTDVTDPTDPQLDKLTHRKDAISFALPKNISAYYVRSGKHKIKVHISKSDITKLDVDCIVNASNKRLQHGGGVSKAISLAAGPALNKACEAFINSGNQVAVTDIFLSTGGNLPAKYVMHAVGPKWDAYDDKTKCLDDLRHTVIRCLVEAGRQGFTSVALPSLSAAFFRVPKEACARCYMEAVKHFATFNEEQTSLKEIHFVDVDDSMVKVIQEHFEKNWTNPCDPHIVQKDCEFTRSHIYSATRNAAETIEKSPNTSKSTSLSTKTPGANKPSSIPGSRLSAGSTVLSTSGEGGDERFAYQIRSFTVNTDTRPAFDLFSDIVITVGQPFDKLSGFPNFYVSDNKQVKESVKKKFKLYHVSKPKSHHQKQLCALFPEPDCEKTIKEALGNLDEILQSPNHKIFAQNIRDVVLTSSILYKEPDNVPNKNQHSYDRKKPGHFAKCLLDYFKHASDISSISITLVGCEDAIQTFHKVMESRDVRKISLEVPQGARSKTSEGSQNRSDGGGACHSRGEMATLFTSYPDAGNSVDLDKTVCPICASEKPCFPLKCCGNCVCQRCQQKVTICPYCRAIWSVLTGNQPPGTMSVNLLHVSVPGYEPLPTWEIKYFFPAGRQKDYHPNPGVPYAGISRTAYLPATDEGFRVLKLLRLAFLRKLTFTIGHSLTTGTENSIIWNDINHKTRISGGMYSYPDPNYLHNVCGELASKGVTFDSISADEMHRMKDFESQIRVFGHFTDAVPQ